MNWIIKVFYPDYRIGFLILKIHYKFISKSHIILESKFSIGFIGPTEFLQNTL